MWLVMEIGERGYRRQGTQEAIAMVQVGGHKGQIHGVEVAMKGMEERASRFSEWEPRQENTDW